MKKALVVVLLVVLAASGVPLIMGASDMPSCPDCGPAVLAGGVLCAVAVLVASTLPLLVLVGQRIRAVEEVVHLRLHAFLLERPPRLA